MREPPLVTVVIPARDAEEWIADAVESVLAQSWPRVECIVVDDGSSDRTAAVAERYSDRIAVLRQEPSGPAVARNLGVANASGPLLAFLDADDRCRSDRLERQIAEMEKEDLDAVLCANEVVGRRPPMGRLVRMRPPAPSVESLLLWRGTVVSVGSSLLVRRAALDAVGGFDETLSTAADWELLLRLVRRSRIGYIDEPLVLYRWHERNLTRNVGLTEQDLRRAYDLIFEREAPLLTVTPRQARGGLHRALAGAHFRLGRPATALRHGFKAGFLDPGALPSAVASRVRRST